MQHQDFTTTILVDQTPEQALEAVTNLRGWWSEDIEGKPDQLNEVIHYKYKDVHLCKLQLTEKTPGKRAVFHVLDNYFSVFSKDKTEWINTDLIFDLSTQNGKTKIQFTHKGLVPDYECYDVCNVAWRTYVNQSLYNLITKGKGQPTPKGEDGVNADLLRERHLIS